MLSRIAESLFWIGRYVERAEDTARILDVHLHAAARGPVGRRGRGLPVAAGASWASPRADERAPTTERCWRCSPSTGRNPSSIAGALVGRPGERPRRPRGRSRRRCGSA